MDTYGGEIEREYRMRKKSSPFYPLLIGLLGVNAFFRMNRHHTVP